MRCCGKALTSVAVLLLAAVLPASAGSISSSYTDTFSVTGTKTPTTVTATFSFDTSKDTIGGQLTFAGGVFNVSDPFSGTATCNKKNTACIYTFSTIVNGDKLTYAITLNLSNGQYGALGGIAKGGNAGAFGGNGYASATVPEGGSRFSYVAPAGLVIFGGIFLTGLMRPRLRGQERV
jgi:hypothetical protein